MQKETIQHMLRLLTVALLLAAVAIQRDGRLLGTDLTPTEQAAEPSPSVATQADGTVIVSTSQLGKGIHGYGGPTPITVSIRNGLVSDVKAEANNESPEFFDEAFQYLSRKWIGRKASDILQDEPDGVTGATMSSHALWQNMQLALQQVERADGATSAAAPATWTLSKLAALFVVALGCILPLFQRFRKFRTLWLCVNVAVLGLWSGTFLSHALLWAGSAMARTCWHRLPLC